MKNKLKVLLPLLFVIALLIALPLTANAEETTVTTDGLNITVSGLSEVRDFLIAPGHHEVYSAIKQSYILRVTGDKFDVSDRYTVAMTSVGEYTTSYDINRAEGAKYIRPSKIDENGEISFEIGEEVYTVCVQYNDGSCNFFTLNEKVLVFFVRV